MNYDLIRKTIGEVPIPDEYTVTLEIDPEHDAFIDGSMVVIPESAYLRIETTEDRMIKGVRLSVPDYGDAHIPTAIPVLISSGLIAVGHLT